MGQEIVVVCFARIQNRNSCIKVNACQRGVPQALHSLSNTKLLLTIPGGQVTNAENFVLKVLSPIMTNKNFSIQFLASHVSLIANYAPLIPLILAIDACQSCSI